MSARSPVRPKLKRHHSTDALFDGDFQPAPWLRRAMTQLRAWLTDSRIKFFDADDLNELVRQCSSLHEVRPGKLDVVFHEGDPGEHFYIVLKGKVQVLVYSGPTEHKLLARGTRNGGSGVSAHNHSGSGHAFYLETPDGMRRAVQVNVVGERGSFGELAIISHGTRTASIRCLTDCVLLRLDKTDYQRLFRCHNFQLNEKIQLVRNLPFTVSWATEKLIQFAYAMHRVAFPAQTAIVREGDDARSVFVVGQGTCVVSVSLHPEDSHNTAVRRDLVEAVPERDPPKRLANMESAIIGHLGPHSIIGDFVVVRDRPYETTVTSSSHVVLYEIPRHRYLQCVTGRHLERAVRVMEARRHKQVRLIHERFGPTMRTSLTSDALNGTVAATRGGKAAQAGSSSSSIEPDPYGPAEAARLRFRLKQELPLLEEAGFIAPRRPVPLAKLASTLAHNEWKPRFKPRANARPSRSSLERLVKTAVAGLEGEEANVQPASAVPSTGHALHPDNVRASRLRASRLAQTLDSINAGQIGDAETMLGELRHGHDPPFNTDDRVLESQARKQKLSFLTAARRDPLGAVKPGKVVSHRTLRRLQDNVLRNCMASAQLTLEPLQTESSGIERLRAKRRAAEARRRASCQEPESPTASWNAKGTPQTASAPTARTGAHSHTLQRILKPTQQRDVQVIGELIHRRRQRRAFTGKRHRRPLHGRFPFGSTRPAAQSPSGQTASMPVLPARRVIEG